MFTDKVINGKIWNMIVRRPLACLFLSFMLGIGSNYIFNPVTILYFAGIVTALLIAVAYVVLLFTKFAMKITTVILCMTIFFCIGGIMCDNELNKADPLEKYVNIEISYWGTIQKYQHIDDDYHKLTVKNGKNKYLLHVTGESLEPTKLIGNKINFTGKVEKPSARRNPGCFDYSLYLKSINIRYVVKCNLDGIEIIPSELCDDPVGWASSRLAGYKYKYLAILSKNMSNDSLSLLNGMLFGNKDDIDEDTYEAFQKNGIAHILSVSGIHVGIVYAFIFMLMRRRMNPLVVAIMFLFLISYAFLSEFSPSVIRAALMIGIHMISRLLKYPYDLLTCTCLAAFVMLVSNPLTLFHVGFQLSYLAVMLLAFLLPLLHRYVGKKKIIGIYKERRKDIGDNSVIGNSEYRKIKVVNLLMPLFILQVGMAPFTAYVFNYFSVAGFFMNIPIIALAGFIIPVGILLMPITLIDIPVVGDICLNIGCRILDFVLDAIIHINDLIFSIKISSFLLVSPLPWVLFMFYGILFFFSSEIFRIMQGRCMMKNVLVVIIAIILSSVLCASDSKCSRDASDVVFVDVGQGDCIHVRTPSGKNLLIDGGGNSDYSVGKKTLMPYLLKNGINKVDYVFVTHLHTDHYRGIKELSRYMNIGKLMTYDGNRVRQEELTGESGININDVVFLGKGDRFLVDKDVYIDVLYPTKKNMDDYVLDVEGEEDENKNSLLMKLHCKGQNILITGDLGNEGERMIIRELKNSEASLKSDILKIGHHGSKYSTSQEFLDFVNPQNAVIQVGVKNTYGHPSGEVLEKLENKDIMVYRNDTDGAVMLDIDRSQAKFRKMIDKE